jgi:predicted nucleic acid-binding protein
VRVVFDASAVVRAVVQETEDARDWTKALEEANLDADVPDLVFAEVANACLGYVRAGGMTRALAEERIGLVRALPLGVRSTRDLVEAALFIALELGLSAYDACYVALAEATEATLVTADGRLAAAYPRSVLLA